MDLLYPLRLEWATDAQLRAGLDLLETELVEPMWPERETWGSTPAAVAGQRAMLDLMAQLGPARKDAE